LLASEDEGRKKAMLRVFATQPRRKRKRGLGKERRR